MKKIMVTVLAVILTLVTSTSVFAATPGDGSKLDKRIVKLQESQQKIEEIKARNLEKQSKLATKKEEFEGFKLDLTEHRQDVLKNRENNISVVELNNQLRLTLAQKLEELKDSGSVIPEETTAQLKAHNAQIAELANSLKDTKGQIKDIVEKYKGFIKEKDYAAMDTAFAEIASIQTYRLDILNQINSILQEMNNLL
ncbi:hypothetical protein E4K67_06990 [Desulfosporosinus fructosivorans]|uniref:Uncharacterized protein n=1 Tax=Desulfosporosinus fructosivorans TaxID=2018669 RepID=A0A4Z0R8N6_9FIRM|nr:hypothetical protein [Desulfosporosinus fructosivorans]TGE39198.1 hypothetical protein E4K67_06990 [Desulfosporosinus fructosivorans]